MSTPTKNEQFEYKAEMKQLLHLIAHSLYTHPEIFLRELISNATDALNKARFRKLSDEALQNSELEMAIKITADPNLRVVTITDTGIGMSREDLIDKIGTVASSGTLELLKQLQEGQKTFDETFIGQFGVGFYSVFMVADQVSIETLSAEAGATGWRWESTGEGTYTLEPIERSQRGTTITLRLKESSQEFSQKYRIKEIINKYSNFVNYPIFLDSERINTIEAIWHKKSGEITETERNEFYKFIANDHTDPLTHLHVNVEGVINVRALLFIPGQAPADLFRLHEEKSVHLYANKVMIQNDCKDLIPDYLRFMKGVIDTADLPLNVSREVTQASPAMLKIKQIITGKILGFLSTLAENEPEKYRTFYKNFGPLLKTGLNHDFENREKIQELLRFETTKTGPEEMVSLSAYVERMQPEQKAIYYLCGENRHVVETHPTLEFFKKQGLEVLLLSEPVDIFIMPSLPDYKEKPLTAIDQAELDIIESGRIETPDNKLTDQLLQLFKNTLADRVENVVISRRLVESPATLVVGKNGMNASMERMMKLMDKNFTAGKKVLELNLNHPLLQNLSRRYLADNADPLLTTCILQIYETAALLDGTLSSMPEFVKRLNTIMEAATK